MTNTTEVHAGRVLAAARNLTRAQADELQHAYWDAAIGSWSGQLHRAGLRAHKRLDLQPDTVPWLLVDEAAGISGAAADAVVAALARDLIPPEDYATLTRVWLWFFDGDPVRAGLAGPGEDHPRLTAPPTTTGWSSPFVVDTLLMLALLVAAVICAAAGNWPAAALGGVLGVVGLVVFVVGPCRSAL